VVVVLAHLTQTMDKLGLLAALAALALSSFVIPHLYYHPLPQQEALR
jgi:hypothetical protein